MVRRYWAAPGSIGTLSLVLGRPFPGIIGPMTKAFGLCSKVYQRSKGAEANDVRKLLKTNIGPEIALQTTKC